MAAAGAAIVADAQFTLPAYMAGSVGIGVAVGALGYGAYRLRGSLLPHWHGAAARLAEVIMALGSLVLSAQLLGSVSSLHATAVLVSAVLAGAVMAATGIVVGGGEPAPATSPDAAPPERRRDVLAAGAAVVVLAAQWFAHTLAALAHGMTEPDTLWYHGPFAARFVQEQSFTGIDHLGPAVARYYPFNAELVHALAILPFGHDLLSPLVNLGWAALALSAAWCIGHRAGVGALSVLATSVVLTLPTIAGGQPGQASNDLPSAALLLVAVALLLHGPLAPVPTGLAAVAAGMALGTKLTAAGIVAALTVGVVVLAVRDRRPRIAVAWCAAVAVAGGYWLLRNWMIVDNPLPWYGFELGPLSFPRTFAEEGSSLIERIGEGHTWRTLYLPGLAEGLGSAWFAVLALVIAAVVALAGRSRRPHERVVALAVVVGAVTYAATPFTGGVGFALNLRYLAGTLLIGLATLPVAVAAASNRVRTAAVAGGLVLVVINVTSSPGHTVPAWPSGFVTSGIVGVVVVGATAALVAVALRTHLVPATTVAGVVAAGLAVAGWPLTHRFLDGRYVAAGLQHDGVNTFFRDVQDADVAVFGTATYPIFGLDLSNRATLLEVPLDGTPSERCRTTVSLLGDRYAYVVLLPSEGGFLLPTQPDERWLAADPAVTLVVRDRDDVAFAVSGALDSDRCESFGEV